jgi:hypothetical protein
MFKKATLKGLSGHTDLGDFMIELDKVKAIIPFEEKETLSNSDPTKSAGIRIIGFKVTDTKGTSVDIRAIKIDYTSYGFIYIEDFEAQGIRVHKGEGILTIPWTNIEKLVLEDSATPNFHYGQVFLGNGEQIEVVFREFSKEK